MAKALTADRIVAILPRKFQKIKKIKKKEKNDCLKLSLLVALNWNSLTLRPSLLSRTR